MQTIKDNINTMIMDAMKAHNQTETTVLRDIKTAIMNWETSKENVGKIFSKGDEVKLIKKLQSQYKETANLCNDGKHYDLVQESLIKAAYIEQFLPEEVSEDDIVRMFLHVRENETVEPIKKNMGVFIKRIKELLPYSDGKLVSEIVKTHLV